MARYFEDCEQAALFDWANTQADLRWLHAIPNGGNRNPREAARLKKQGVKPGVYDVFLPIPVSPWHGLYIEMKRRKKQGPSSVSAYQKEFAADMAAMGYQCVVCYGAEEAIAAIKYYLPGFNALPTGG